MKSFELANKFGIITHSGRPFFPMSSKLLETTEDGIELYEMKCLDMLQGHTTNKFGVSYSYYPVEYHHTPIGEKVDSKGAIDHSTITINSLNLEKDDEDLHRIIGFYPKKLLVASFQPSGSLLTSDWKGDPKPTRITYAGKTHNIACSNVRKAMKKLVQDKMGI